MVRLTPVGRLTPPSLTLLRHVFRAVFRHVFCLLRHVFFIPSKSVARDRSSRRLNIMVRAIASTVACDLG